MAASDVRRAWLVVLVALTLVASAFTALPASAHPEECEEDDESCEDEGKGSNEAGEATYLEDGDSVLERGEGGVFETSQNMHPLGFSERAVPLSGAGSGRLNSDLAFSGNLAIQGHYGGFRIIDVSEPEDPIELVNYEDCISGSAASGGQGDVVVYGDILVRSWDAPAPAGGRFCGEVFTPQGQEGVHIFDISDPTAPVALKFVATPCGSHTASGVPDLANDRLLIYNSASSAAAACRGIDIIDVPLDDPAAATYVRFVRSGVAGALPAVVTVDAPSAAAGTYAANSAAWGVAPPAGGLSGDLVLVDSSTGTPSEGCGPLVDFPAGAIALVDRGTCGFVDKARNAQDAGAVAIVVVSNVAGAPGTMGGTDPSITIPGVMVSMSDGTAIKAGLPAGGSVALNPTPPDRACHDTGVILGSVLKAACAGGNGLSVWSMDPADGGSLELPVIQYSRYFPGVTIGHSAAFTWDGEVIVFGHEPGGGGQAQCQATSPEVNRTLFFLDAASGDTVGTFLQPRPQTSTENCTWHNYNVVPTDRNYVLVSGNYQMGITVVNFSDPANASQLGYADPAPLSETSLITGGDWSTYWYDGFIYQSDIRRGLITWKLSDAAVGGARKLGHLNPQTQEISFAKGKAFGRPSR